MKSSFLIGRAVMQYLCNKHCSPATQHLYPLGAEERGTVDRLLCFDMGTLSHAIREYFKPRVYEGLAPDAEKENLLKQSLDYLDTYLLAANEDGDKPLYLTGDTHTIADLAILASITELDAMDYSYRCYGDLTRYVNRLKEKLPHYKQCCEKGIEMTRQRVKQVEDDLRARAEKERKSSATKK